MWSSTSIDSSGEGGIQGLETLFWVTSAHSKGTLRQSVTCPGLPRELAVPRVLEPVSRFAATTLPASPTTGGGGGTHWPPSPHTASSTHVRTGGGTVSSRGSWRGGVGQRRDQGGGRGPGLTPPPLPRPAGRRRALPEQRPVQEQVLPPGHRAEPGPLRAQGQREQRVLCQGRCQREGGQLRGGGPSGLEVGSGMGEGEPGH